jgi:hypothetical protein
MLLVLKFQFAAVLHFVSFFIWVLRCLQVKVKVTLDLAMKAQRGSRVIAVLFP